MFSKSLTAFSAAFVASLVSFSTFAGSNNKLETESVNLFLRLPTFAKASSDRSPALFKPSVSKSTPANKAVSGNEIKFKSPSKISLFLFAASICPCACAAVVSAVTLASSIATFKASNFNCSICSSLNPCLFSDSSCALIASTCSFANAARSFCTFSALVSASVTPSINDSSSSLYTIAAAMAAPIKNIGLVSNALPTEASALPIP